MWGTIISEGNNFVKRNNHLFVYSEAGGNIKRNTVFTTTEESNLEKSNTQDNQGGGLSKRKYRKKRTLRKKNKKSRRTLYKKNKKSRRTLRKKNKKPRRTLRKRK